MTEQENSSYQPQIENMTDLDRIATELTRLGDSTDEADRYWRIQLYRRANELNCLDTRKLGEFLVRHLLKDCLLGIQSDDKNLSMDRHTLRNILIGWLESIPDDVLWEARHYTLPEVLGILSAATSEEHLYIATSLGYRDPTVIREFFRIIEEVPSLRDTTIRLLATMRVQGSDKDRLLELIEENARLGPLTHSAQIAAAILGGQVAIQQVFEAGVSTGEWTTFANLGILCKHQPGNAAWQQAIWQSIRSLAKTIEQGWSKLLFVANAAECCYTPEVAHDLFTQVRETASADLVLFDRLASKIGGLQSQSQISGLVSVDRTKTTAAIFPFAVAATGPENTPWQTQAAHCKKHAWITALMLGSPDVLSWATEAIDREPNSYQQHSMMETVAVLSLRTLPETTVELLTKTDVAFTSKTEGAEILPFLGAARLASSSLSRESLELLMGSSGLIDDSPFRNVVDNTATLAAWLIVNGDGSVIDNLATWIIDKSLTASAAAMRAILELPSPDVSSLPKEVLAALEKTARDNSRPAYIRAEAISAITYLGEFRKELIGACVELCDHADPKLRANAAHALLDAGGLENYQSAINRCALRSFDDRADVGAERLTNFEAHLVGRLATMDANTYSEYVFRIIRSSGFLTWTLDSTIAAIRQAKRKGIEISPAICYEIVQHLRATESQSFANPSLFVALAELDPMLLLNEAWEEIWDGWMAESKQALLDVMVHACRHASQATMMERGKQIATHLLTDENFATRRSAARALSRLDETALRGTCEDFISSGSILLRTYAAEAAGWLSIDGPDTLDNEILRRLSDDAEARVRSACEQSRKDAQLRHWAAEHTKHIANRVSDPNQWVLHGFANGVALANTGDDADIEWLKMHCEDREFPPNVRHWYRRILKELESRWKKITGKWPNPQYSWRGSIEKLSGMLESHGHRFTADFTLWSDVSIENHQHVSWGGAARLETGERAAALKLISGPGGSKVTISLDGRQPASMLIASSSGGDVVLTGTGPYPIPEPVT